MYEEIEYNPALRSLAKIALNSFWGKYAQRLGMKQTMFLDETEADNFFQMLSDPRKQVSNFYIVSKEMIQLEWTDDRHFLPIDRKTNIFIAAFTTTWARLRLYDVLDTMERSLPRSILYYDTDSFIGVVSKNSSVMSELPVGNFLGDLTNEIPSEDGHIEEFVSGGPKNYAFRTTSMKEVCKVRGFSLNFHNSKMINFDVIKEMVVSKNYDASLTTYNPCKISRLARKRKLYNREERKKYRIVYTKRRLLDDMDTLPYGF